MNDATIQLIQRETDGKTYTAWMYMKSDGSPCDLAPSLNALNVIQCKSRDDGKTMLDIGKILTLFVLDPFLRNICACMQEPPTSMYTYRIEVDATQMPNIFRVSCALTGTDAYHTMFDSETGISTDGVAGMREFQDTVLGKGATE